MELIQTQVAFFFKQDFKKDFEYFSLALKEIFGSSNKTLLIPLSNDEPSEIPRLTLNYNGFNINVAKSRLDIFILDKQFLDEVPRLIIDKLFENLSIIIGRLGFIKTFFKPSEISELKRLLNNELQQKEFREINIRLSERIKCLGYDCNSIEKIDFGTAQKTIKGVPHNVEGQVIQRDINTANELDVILDKSNLAKLIIEFNKVADNRIIKS